MHAFVAAGMIDESLPSMRQSSGGLGGVQVEVFDNAVGPHDAEDRTHAECNPETQFHLCMRVGKIDLSPHLQWNEAVEEQ